VSVPFLTLTLRRYGGAMSCLCVAVISRTRICLRVAWHQLLDIVAKQLLPSIVTEQQLPDSVAKQQIPNGILSSSC